MVGHGSVGFLAMRGGPRKLKTLNSSNMSYSLRSFKVGYIRDHVYRGVL